MGCSGFTPQIPRDAPGGSLGFVAGLGDSIANLLELGGAVANPVQGSINIATGNSISGAYTRWAARHGVNTSPHSTYTGGQWAGAVLQMALGGLAGGLGAAEEAGAARTVEILGPKEFNPNSLEGLTPNEVRNSIPSDWIQSTSKSGGGEVFRDPVNAGRQIRIMPGYPAGSRPDLITTGPYSVVSQNGVVTKIPLFGNPVLP